jgi:hypothetical protein
MLIGLALGVLLTLESPLGPIFFDRIGDVEHPDCDERKGKEAGQAQSEAPSYELPVHFNTSIKRGALMARAPRFR